MVFNDAKETRKGAKAQAGGMVGMGDAKAFPEGPSTARSANQADANTDAASRPCDWCGKPVDPSLDFLNLLSCTVCGVRTYHTDCNDQYLTKIHFNKRGQTNGLGGNYRCPRGRGKVEGPVCERGVIMSGKRSVPRNQQKHQKQIAAFVEQAHALKQPAKFKEKDADDAAAQAARKQVGAPAPQQQQLQQPAQQEKQLAAEQKPPKLNQGQRLRGAAGLAEFNRLREGQTAQQVRVQQALKAAAAQVKAQAQGTSNRPAVGRFIPGLHEEPPDASAADVRTAGKGKGKQPGTVAVAAGQHNLPPGWEPVLTPAQKAQRKRAKQAAQTQAPGFGNQAGVNNQHGEVEQARGSSSSQPPQGWLTDDKIRKYNGDIDGDAFDAWDALVEDEDAVNDPRVIYEEYDGQLGFGDADQYDLYDNPVWAGPSGCDAAGNTPQQHYESFDGYEDGQYNWYNAEEEYQAGRTGHYPDEQDDTQAVTRAEGGSASALGGVLEPDAQNDPAAQLDDIDWYSYAVGPDGQGQQQQRSNDPGVTASMSDPRVMSHPLPGSTSSSPADHEDDILANASALSALMVPGHPKLGHSDSSSFTKAVGVDDMNPPPVATLAPSLSAGLPTPLSPVADVAMVGVPCAAYSTDGHPLQLMQQRPPQGILLPQPMYTTQAHQPAVLLQQPAVQMLHPLALQPMQLQHVGSGSVHGLASTFVALPHAAQQPGVQPHMVPQYIAVAPQQQRQVQTSVQGTSLLAHSMPGIMQHAGAGLHAGIRAGGHLLLPEQAAAKAAAAAAYFAASATIDNATAAAGSTASAAGATAHADVDVDELMALLSVG